MVTLSTQDNPQLLEHLNSGLKWTINRNKYQSVVSTHAQNNYLDLLRLK